MSNIDRYINKDGKKMRLGYTTGSCAAAASKAAAIMLMTGDIIESVHLMTPSGIGLTLEIHDITVSGKTVKCAVRKDSGDDPDVTNGMFIYAMVTLTDDPEILIDGGDGIGRVTKPGLDQPIGNAAINSVPRRMITQELKYLRDEYHYSGGFIVIISAPDGEEIAARTFNSRMGIIGGISVLGTSGIVEPMSDNAVVDTVRKELDMRIAAGSKYLLLTPGNYGEGYIKDTLKVNPDEIVKCSNFIGDSIEYAAELGFGSIILIGHIGKLIKLAGGLFNTHSRYGDCRAEITAAHAAMFGIDPERTKRIFDSATVDEMLVILDEIGTREQVMASVTARIEFLLNERIKLYSNRAEIAAVLFSLKCGLLGRTQNAENLINKINGGTE